MKKEVARKKTEKINLSKANRSCILRLSVFNLEFRVFANSLHNTQH